MWDLSVEVLATACDLSNLRETGMNTDSPSFCVMPWVHLHANPDGVATLCCQSHRRLFSMPKGKY